MYSERDFLVPSQFRVRAKGRVPYSVNEEVDLEFILELNDGLMDAGLKMNNAPMMR